MKKIIINATLWQTRAAIMRDNELQNIYFSPTQDTSLERSFFKGIVTKVLPGIQTAFVDIGQEKAGFLHISEIDRELALQRMSPTVDLEDIPEKTTSQERPYQVPDISKILKEGEPILVQVSKEPVYEKGAKLTTCFTLPGRFIVLLPNIPRIAISKKIEQKQERGRLKDILLAHLPPTMGAIIRTTSENRQEKEIIHDLRYLVNSWNTIQKNYNQASPEQKVYEDLPLPLRVIRDNLDNDVETVVIDDKKVYSETYSFTKTIAPEFSHIVKHYTGPQPIFEKYQINQQIEEALSSKVSLKSGGSIIIEQTQAMTVIDVNTGRFIGKSDLEDTIVKTNMEAAEEIVRQLRLRNIGGIIVIDFIDMAAAQNQVKLIRFFEKTLKERDKFQSVVLKVSEFGLVQMTRKRSGKTLQQELTEQCTTCKGLGVVKSTQTQCFHVLAKLEQELKKHPVKQATIELNSTMFTYVSSTQYNSILALEKKYGCKLTLKTNDELPVNQYRLSVP